MAKKSNKTEHVLKLISKHEDEEQDDLFGVRHDNPGKDTYAEVESNTEVEKKEPKNREKSQKSEEPEKKEKGNKKEEPRATDHGFSADGLQETEKSAIQEPQSQLVNVAEVLLREKIGLVMERMKVCTCQNCVNDVLALALNTLPAKYVTTDSGKQHLQLDVYKKQHETDVLAALTKACVRVKASPRHERMG